jgi:hypothetical protein
MIWRITAFARFTLGSMLLLAIGVEELRWLGVPV